MDWVMVRTIIGVNIALFAALATLVIWAVNKMDTDVKAIGTRMDGHAIRIDQFYSVMLKIMEKKGS